METWDVRQRLEVHPLSCIENKIIPDLNDKFQSYDSNISAILKYAIVLKSTNIIVTNLTSFQQPWPQDVGMLYDGL